MKDARTKTEKNDGAESLIVILHNIRSAYNVGSVFRSADAFGVDKIYLGGYTPDPGNNRSISKTALGAESFVPWEKFWHTGKLIGQLKRRGFQLIALEQSPKSKQINKFKPVFPMALILGNEVKGLSEAILAKTDKAVEIIMQGNKESLNVSVAFGIAAHHITMHKSSSKS